MIGRCRVGVVACALPAFIATAAYAGDEPFPRGALVAMFTRLRGSPERLQTRLVPGMGHAWSGGDPRGSHTVPPGPDATEEMLEFLVR
jgi:dienelactone hydrolase